MSDKYIRLDDALAALDKEEVLYTTNPSGYRNGVLDALFHAKEAIAALPAVTVAGVRAVTPAMIEAYITAVSTHMTGDLRADVARGIQQAMKEGLK